MKVLFLIEDGPDIITLWRRHVQRFPDQIRLVTASTFAEVDTVLETETFFDLVVMDGMIGGKQGDTVPLVQKIREVFKGPMVAASSDPKSVTELMEAGCDLGAKSKVMAINIVLHELGLNG